MKTMKTTRAGRDTRTRAPPTPTTPTPTRLFAPSLVRAHHRPTPSRRHHHPSPSRARVVSPMRAMRAMRMMRATRTTTTRDTETARRLHPTHRPLVESRHHRARRRDPSIHPFINDSTHVGSSVRHAATKSQSHAIRLDCDRADETRRTVRDDRRGRSHAGRRKERDEQRNARRRTSARRYGEKQETEEDGGRDDDDDGLEGEADDDE